MDCLRSDDLVGIGMEADAVRRRLHPEGVASYAVGARLEWPCAGAEDGAFFRAGELAVEAGATGLQIAGTVDGGRVDGTLRELRRHVPGAWIEALTADEVVRLGSAWGMGLREAMTRLVEAGLDSIAPDGPDLREGWAEWMAVHRAAHEAGMRTRAGMVFGSGEALEQRVDFLAAVRRLQEKTGGFAAFVPIAARPASGRELDGVTAVERLKTLAVARMFLDNVENAEAVRAGDGLKVLQTALRFGANDAGAVTPEGSREEDVRRVIRDAGFRPAQRDAAYRVRMLG